MFWFWLTLGHLWLVIWSTSWAVREINLYIIGPVTIRSEMCKLSIASLKFHSPASSRRSISTESGVSVDSLDSQGEGVQFWREENSKQTWTDLTKPVLLYVFFFWFPLVYTTCHVILDTLWKIHISDWSKQHTLRTTCWPSCTKFLTYNFLKGKNACPATPKSLEKHFSQRKNNNLTLPHQNP